MAKNSHLIYGIRPVMEAIESDREIDKVILQKGGNSDMFKELFRLIRQKEIPFQYVPGQKLNQYTGGNHQGVVCMLSPIVYQKVENIIPSLYEEGKTPFLLLLDRITDVRNMGAIVRSAACAGVDAIIVPSKGSAQMNEDAFKTSAGALHSMPVCRYDNLKALIAYLKESGLHIVACAEKAPLSYCQHTAYTNPLCIILGNEADGIRSEYLALCDRQVSIPMKGKIESLNVSVAAGIVLFEAVRQREQEKKETC